MGSKNSHNAIRQSKNADISLGDELIPGKSQGHFDTPRGSRQPDIVCGGTRHQARGCPPHHDSSEAEVSDTDFADIHRFRGAGCDQSRGAPPQPVSQSVQICAICVPPQCFAAVDRTRYATEGLEHSGNAVGFRAECRNYQGNSSP